MGIHPPIEHSHGMCPVQTLTVLCITGIGGVSGPPGEDQDWKDRPINDDWTANVYQVQPQSALTEVIGHKLVCKAGDVALFDTSIWCVPACASQLSLTVCRSNSCETYSSNRRLLRDHRHTASPNTSDRDRENTIIAYRGAAVGTVAGDVGEGNSSVSTRRIDCC